MLVYAPVLIYEFTMILLCCNVYLTLWLIVKFLMGTLLVLLLFNLALPLYVWGPGGSLTSFAMDSEFCTYVLNVKNSFSHSSVKLHAVWLFVTMVHSVHSSIQSSV